MDFDVAETLHKMLTKDSLLTKNNIVASSLHSNAKRSLSRNHLFVSLMARSSVYQINLFKKANTVYIHILKCCPPRSQYCVVLLFLRHPPTSNEAISFQTKNKHVSNIVLKFHIVFAQYS